MPAATRYYSFRVLRVADTGERQVVSRHRMEGLVELLVAAALGAVAFIDRWAVANYAESESARSWCRAQFMWSHDPRRGVLVSSYVLIAIAIVVALYGAAAVVGVG